ncbi:hypothetical protein [Rhodococcus sp. OK302]|uniref:hypothetical protein n=1 Tax=Rhodococcus sp. OK302 TaxID=1882769 RepID=UPI0020CD4322|nr:hypothetical protein [Rhodococcus sp. OK302]
MATTMTTGNNLVSRFPGVARGISGGACSVTSPPGARGASRRGRRGNLTVLNSLHPQQ